MCFVFDYWCFNDHYSDVGTKSAAFCLESHKDQDLCLLCPLPTFLAFLLPPVFQGPACPKVSQGLQAMTLAGCPWSWLEPTTCVDLTALTMRHTTTLQKKKEEEKCEIVKILHICAFDIRLPSWLSVHVLDGKLSQQRKNFHINDSFWYLWHLSDTALDVKWR